jgi:LAO/AO transport system kinase
VIVDAPAIARRALARALSRVADASVAEVLAMSRGAAAPCRRIGVTGSPGVGKSSLIARLSRARLGHPGTLAVIAIDPTSPHSGGAILGDRIRMQELEDEPRIFIRSLASRISQDGLTDNLADILALVEGAGFAEVIVETVGVGQVGYAIRHMVDSNVLVLMPGEGDHIQAMKSGILETADICVVNKADLPGARQLATDLRSVLHGRGGAWTPEVVAVGPGDAAAVAALSEAIDRHQAWLDGQDVRDATQMARRAQHLASLLARRTAEIIRTLPAATLRQDLGAAYAEIVAEMHRTDTAPPHRR